MKTKILFTAAIVFCLGIASVQAQISERAYDQHGRIVNGMRRGELTKKEAHRLAKQQKHIRKEMRHAQRDGHLSRAERKRIARDQYQANRKIFRYKHNHASRF